MFALGQKGKQARPRTKATELPSWPLRLAADTGVTKDGSCARWQEARSEAALCLQTYCPKCHGYHWKTSIIDRGHRSLVPLKTEQKFRCGGRKGEECAEGGNTGVTPPHSSPTFLCLLCPFPLHLHLLITASFSLCNGRKIIDLFKSICPSFRGYLVSLSFFSTVPGMTAN